MPSPDLPSHRGPDDLSPLTLDQILPLDPNELARTHTSGDLQGRAMGEAVLAIGYQKQADELEEQILVLRAQAEDARARAQQFTEAAQIAHDIESGN